MYSKEELYPGQVLRELREKLGYTQTVLEDSLGWGIDTLRKIENGERRFTHWHLESLRESGFLEQTRLTTTAQWILRFQMAMEVEWEEKRRSAARDLGIGKGQMLRGLSECNFQRHQIVAHVYDKHRVELDQVLGEAFFELNKRRKQKGLLEFFASTCYRLISPPEITESHAELHCTPINFAYLALLLSIAR